ncbi:S41 family peptidase [Chloroflexota bacterium]
MKINKTIPISFAILIAIVAAFGAGFWLHAEMYPTQAHFPVLTEAYQIIQEHGYENIPESPTLEYGAIYGLIGAYGDQHTHFFEPVQAELNNDSLSGSYGGIGAQLGRDSGGFIVLHPFPESPASESGLQDGDRLLFVDGMPITPESTIEQVIAMIRGPQGKNSKITIARPPNFVEMEFSIKRANIPLPSVMYHLDSSEPRMGVVRINVIASSTPDEIQDAVKELQTRGATHFTLDLRGNGGGLLNEGVEIARIFLKDGVVIQHQYKDENIKTYEVKKNGPLTQIPLAILIDSNTASAAEIISGALQHQERAPLIGTQSFGKDSIQLVYELSDKSSLHVTSAKWWVPGLFPPIGEGGLVPDISVSTDNTFEYDPFIDAAIEYFFGN